MYMHHVWVHVCFQDEHMNYELLSTGYNQCGEIDGILWDWCIEVVILKNIKFVTAVWRVSSSTNWSCGSDHTLNIREVL